MLFCVVVLEVLYGIVKLVVLFGEVGWVVVELIVVGVEILWFGD